MYVAYHSQWARVYCIIHQTLPSINFIAWPQIHATTWKPEMCRLISVGLILTKFLCSQILVSYGTRST